MDVLRMSERRDIRPADTWRRMTPEQHRMVRFFKREAGEVVDVDPDHPLIREFDYADEQTVCVEFPTLNVVLAADGRFTPLPKLKRI